MPLRLIDASGQCGACHARNRGAMASHGERLLFCDADDMVAPGWVTQGWQALKHHDLVGGLTRELRHPHDPDAPVIFPAILVGPTGREAVISSNLGVRRDAFFAVGGFDESLPPYGVHDIEFSLRTRHSGRTIGAAPEMVVYFRRTVDPRKLARKIYRSGQTETLVWLRHPSYFPPPVGRTTALVRLAQFPVDAARRISRDRAIDKRALARDLLTRAGQARAYLPGGVQSSDTAAKLLKPTDDPHNQSGVVEPLPIAQEHTL